MESHLIKLDAVKWAQSGFATDRKSPAIHGSEEVLALSQKLDKIRLQTKQ